MKQHFTKRQHALEGVEAFLQVARQNNFRRAAAALGVTPSAVSQAVRALEVRVGAALFVRTTRSVGMTEAGQRFFERAAPAYEELVAASDAARSLGQHPSGLLRLTVPRAVVPLLLEPAIASFCQRYPEVEVEIAASDELLDLAEGGFDAGIRLGQHLAPDMVAVRLSPPFRLAVVASPSYLATRKPPRSLTDLAAHSCLRVRRSAGQIAPWQFVDQGKGVDVQVKGQLIAHDYATILGAALEGVGLAQLPEPLAAVALRSGRLKALLPAYAPTAPGVFLYHPGRRQILPKLRAFIEHVRYDRRAARRSRETRLSASAT